MSKKPVEAKSDYVPSIQNAMAYMQKAIEGFGAVIEMAVYCHGNIYANNEYDLTVTANKNGKAVTFCLCDVEKMGVGELDQFLSSAQKELGA